MSEPKRQSRCWRYAVMTLMSYEVVAFISGGKVPYITNLVRGLPRPLRWVASLVVAAAVHDHFDTQRLF